MDCSLFLYRFVGKMSSMEARARFQATAVDGSFFVRESEKRAGEMCLVVLANNDVKHLKIGVSPEVFNAKIIIIFYYYLTHMIFVVPCAVRAILKSLRMAMVFLACNL